MCWKKERGMLKQNNKTNPYYLLKDSLYRGETIFYRFRSGQQLDFDNLGNVVNYVSFGS